MSSKNIPFDKPSAPNHHKIVEKSSKCPKSGSGIQKVILDTPIGSMEITVCDSGLHTIQHESDVIMETENFSPNMSSPMNVRPHPCCSNDSEETNYASNTSDIVERNELEVTNLHLRRAVCWLRHYFGVNEQRQPLILGNGDGHKNHEFCIPNSTEFEHKVWVTLLEGTGPGETITYQNLAEKVNCPRGSRAVGGAMRRNPILILIPCHRVIRSDGGLGNYNGGVCIKEFLQQHEKTHFSSSNSN